MDTSTASIIFRHQSDTNIGIQTLRYSRNVIGYVEQGTKHIHQADRYVSVQAGELFHLPSGTHYIEDRPSDPSQPFRQTLFFYSASDLRNGFLPSESVSQTNHLCSRCRHQISDIYTYPAWPVVQDFFHATSQYIETQVHLSSPELGHLKLCELFQLLMAQPGCCISRPICQALANGPNSLHDIVRENILTGLGLTELATLCGMSLSMFKNEFRRHFNTSPHRWLNEQRLAYARLQLITTQRPISAIAAECRFNNSSHFIKLFRERFSTTPAAYRRDYQS